VTDFSAHLRATPGGVTDFSAHLGAAPQGVVEAPDHLGAAPGGVADFPDHWSCPTPPPRTGELRPSVAHLPLFELELSTMLGRFVERALRLGRPRCRVGRTARELSFDPKVV
jgi:hypothetical protein